jgi:hypothetical protein
MTRPKKIGPSEYKECFRRAMGTRRPVYIAKAFDERPMQSRLFGGSRYEQPLCAMIAISRAHKLAERSSIVQPNAVPCISSVHEHRNRFRQ